MSRSTEAATATQCSSGNSSQDAGPDPGEGAGRGDHVGGDLSAAVGEGALHGVGDVACTVERKRRGEERKRPAQDSTPG